MKGGRAREELSVAQPAKPSARDVGGGNRPFRCAAPPSPPPRPARTAATTLHEPHWPPRTAHQFRAFFFANRSSRLLLSLSHSLRSEI